MKQLPSDVPLGLGLGKLNAPIGVSSLLIICWSGHWLLSFLLLIMCTHNNWSTGRIKYWIKSNYWTCVSSEKSNRSKTEIIHKKQQEIIWLKTKTITFNLSHLSPDDVKYFQDFVFTKHYKQIFSWAPLKRKS